MKGNWPVKKCDALGWICLCRKARKIKMGFMESANSLGRDGVLVMFSSDVSQNTKSKMQRLAEKNMVPTGTLPFTADEIWRACGRRAAVMAVTDEGMAAQLVSFTEREEMFI